MVRFLQFLGLALTGIFLWMFVFEVLGTFLVTTVPILFALVMYVIWPVALIYMLYKIFS